MNSMFFLPMPNFANIAQKYIVCKSLDRLPTNLSLLIRRSHPIKCTILCILVRGFLVRQTCSSHHALPLILPSPTETCLSLHSVQFTPQDPSRPNRQVHHLILSHLHYSSLHRHIHHTIFCPIQRLSNQFHLQVSYFISEQICWQSQMSSVGK